jgi:hypothetical protein
MVERPRIRRVKIEEGREMQSEKGFWPPRFENRVIEIARMVAANVGR